MLDVLWTLIGGNLSDLLAGLGGPLSAAMAFLWGRERTKRKAAEDATKRAERGRQGAQDAQQDLKDGRTPEQIVRDNDGAWR